MQYKIIVDKQSRTNPSADKKEYVINIEELRTNGNISDSIVITKDEAYVLRKLKLTEYLVLEELENPVKQTLADAKIELFEGDNYIYLIDMTGNKFYAEYIIKNDLTDMYATKLELSTAINQTAYQIQLLAKQKLGKEELSTELQVNSEAIKIAWNKISDYIQMMIANGNASLAILDQNKKILMALDKTGQHFYNNGKTMDIGAFDCYFPSYDNICKSLMFALNEKSTNNFMAWGYKTTAENGKTTYIPVIYLGGNSDDDYGFHIENDIILNFNKIRLKKSKIYDNNDSLCFEIGEDLFYGDTRDNKEIFSVYNNSNGTKTFRIFGDDSNPIMIDSSGNFVLASGKIILDNNGNIDCVHLYQTGDSSDIRIKSNIKDSSESAIDIINKIHHKEFDKKGDNTHYKIGYIAQEMEQIDKNFVVKKQANKEKGIEERYYMNQLPILATATKAIQEQQKQIEELKQRIENLEKGEKNGNT